MDSVQAKVKDAVIRASSIFREDKVEAYKKAIERETVPRAKWVLETMLENALQAKINSGPLCDDTGIPHLFLEVGPNRNVTGNLLNSINSGIAQGLRDLPGRPMAINGDDYQRIDQSGGLNSDPAALLPSPLIIRPIAEDTIRLYILMQGGGPEIRGKTYRIFHQHKVSIVQQEIVNWAVESVGQLGCTPCTLAVGIGRSHFEATSLLMEAQVYGNYSVQSELEKTITERVNESNVGPLGLNGKTSVLATFLKVGPQRASGVRIVCLRPCCCVEPRVARVEL